MAAGGVDGSITIKTGLDNSGFKKESDALRRAIASLEASFQKLKADTEQAFAKLGQSGDATAKTKTLEKTVEDLNAQLVDMKKNAQEANNAAAQVAKDTQAAMEAEVNAAEQSVKTQQMTAAEKLAIITKFALEQKRIREQEAAQAGQEGAQDALAPSEGTVSMWERLGETMRNVREGFFSFIGLGARISEDQRQAETGGFRLGEALKNVGQSALRAAGNLGRMIGRGVMNGMKSIAQHAGQAAKKLLTMGHSAKQSGGGFTHGLKNMLKYALGIRSLFALVRKIKSAFKEGLGNLEKYSAPVKSAIGQMNGALATLKNALASAFAPIITAVAPAITTLINLLADAINYVGAFIAALTGQSTYTKAVKQTAAIASNTASAAGSAKDLKRTLAGFDELEILSANSGGGGGGGGGAGGAGGMFETATIDSGITNFIDKMKKLFEEGDWDGIGRVIANRLNGIIEKVKEWVSWDNVGETVTNWVNAITEGFNGLVDGFDWENMGATIAEFINTITNTFDLLINGIDWANLAASIMEGLNSFIDDVDWEGIGENISSAFNGALAFIHTAVKNADWKKWGKDLAAGCQAMIDNTDWAEIGQTFEDTILGIVDFGEAFLEGVDWYQLGVDVADAFKNVDWNMVSDKVFEFLGEAFGAFGAFIGGLFADAFTDIYKYFQDKVEACGGDIWAGVLQGIEDGLLGIFGWLNRHVFTPFLNGFMKLFGISSPSTVMKEQGGYIIAGLKEGISGEAGNWGGWFQTTILDPILTGLGNLFGMNNGGEGEQNKDGHYNVYVKLLPDGWTTVGGWLNDKGGSTPLEISAKIATTGKMLWDSFSEARTNMLLNYAVSLDAKIIATEDMLWASMKDAREKITAYSVSVGAKVAATAQLLWDSFDKARADLLIDSNKVVSLQSKIISTADMLWKGLENARKKLITDYTVSLGAGIASTAKLLWDSFADARAKLLIDYSVPLIANIASDAKGLWNSMETERKKLLTSYSVPLGAGITSTAKLLWDSFSQARATMLVDYSVPLVAKISTGAKGLWDSMKTARNYLLLNYTVSLGAKISSTAKLLWDSFSATRATMLIDYKVPLAAKIVSTSGDMWGSALAARTALTNNYRLELKGKIVSTASELWSSFATARLALKQYYAAEISAKIGTGSVGLWNSFATARMALTQNYAIDLRAKIATVSADLWKSFSAARLALKNNYAADIRAKIISTSADLWKSLYSARVALKSNYAVNLQAKIISTAAQLWKSLEATRTILKEQYKLPLSAKIVATGQQLSESAKSIIALFTKIWDGLSPTVSMKVAIKESAISEAVNDAQGTVNSGNKFGIQRTGGGGSTRGGGASGAYILKIPAKVEVSDSELTADVKNVQNKIDTSSSLGLTMKITNMEPTKEAIKSVRTYLEGEIGKIKVAFKAVSGYSKAVVISHEARGGIIPDGLRGLVRSIPQYARGTLAAHGTMFLAGENGPEIMGHINGKTEILNRSQIAAAMYGATLKALSQVMYRSPRMASGTVMPYEVAAQYERGTEALQSTIETGNDDVIQAVVSAISSAAVAIVGAINQSGAAAARGGGLSAEDVVRAINQRSMMFGVSPLKG